MAERRLGKEHQLSWVMETKVMKLAAKIGAVFFFMFVSCCLHLFLKISGDPK